MNIARVVFGICVILVVLHFKDSWWATNAPGVTGAASAPANASRPGVYRGSYLMQETTGSPRFGLTFLDDKRVQMYSDGKVLEPMGTYNIFDDHLYVYHARDVWDLEIKGPALYRKDYEWTFSYTGK